MAKKNFSTFLLLGLFFSFSVFLLIDSKTASAACSVGTSDLPCYASCGSSVAPSTACCDNTSYEDSSCGAFDPQAYPLCNGGCSGSSGYCCDKTSGDCSDDVSKIEGCNFYGDINSSDLGTCDCPDGGIVECNVSTADCISHGSGCTLTPVSASDAEDDTLGTCDCPSTVGLQSCDVSNADCTSLSSDCTWTANFDAAGNGTLGAQTDNSQPSAGTDNSQKAATPNVNLVNPIIGVTSVPALIGNIINAALGIVGSLALIMFIYGGFTWMLAAGNEQAVEKGRNILMWAAIGLVVIFASYSLVSFVIGAITKGG